jgi:hypothetical protein
MYHDGDNDGVTNRLPEDDSTPLREAIMEAIATTREVHGASAWDVARDLSARFSKEDVEASMAWLHKNHYLYMTIADNYYRIVSY